MLTLAADSVVAVGAHCDDVAIGAGATLLALSRANPRLRIDVLVLTGAGSGREQEERAALSAFCPGAELSVEVLDLPDGRVPLHWERAKEAVASLRSRCEPDLVLAPAPRDAHQDHRALSALVPTEFRGHLTLGYEILKWESDLTQPCVFVGVDETAALKVDLLHEHYPSQHSRAWFDAEAFFGLMRARGVQSGHRYAEGFHTTKLVFSNGSDRSVH